MLFISQWDNLILKKNLISKDFEKGFEISCSDNLLDPCFCGMVNTKCTTVRVKFCLYKKLVDCIFIKNETLLFFR